MPPNDSAERRPSRATSANLMHDQAFSMLVVSLRARKCLNSGAIARTNNPFKVHAVVARRLLSLVSAVEEASHNIA